MGKQRIMVPQNIEAEEGIICCLLVDPTAITRITDSVDLEDFYKAKYRVLYEAMLALDRNHQPIDTITLSEEVERSGRMALFDSFFVEVGELYQYEANASRIEEYAEIVHHMRQLRDVIKLAQEMVQDAYSHDLQTVSKAEEGLSRISQGKSLQRVVPISQASETFISNLIELHERRLNGVVTGVPTGFTLLDYVLGGLQPSDLITLAARPAVGKTSFCLNIAHQVMGNSLKDGKRVLMFSLEMGQEQLMRRLYSMETGIDQTRLRTGAVDDEEWERVMAAHKSLSAGQMWIDDTAGISLQDMRSRARRVQSQHGLDLIIVDYMQLMKATLDNGKLAENRVQEVSLLSRGLKELARELNVPLLSLAQLSRAVEQRQDKTPQLSDLRESGSIEQDSDVVMFIHRDPKMPADDQGCNLDIMIAKHRNGPVGTIPLRFIPRLTKFYDVEPEQYQEE
jgi:replicative DNA helicase